MLCGMGGARPLDAVPDAPEARRPKAAGAWVVYLIFALFLLVLILFDAQAVYQHQWANVAGISVFAGLFLTVPTGAAKWLRGVLRNQKSAR
jgi:hypothetical protein